MQYSDEIPGNIGKLQYSDDILDDIGKLKGSDKISNDIGEVKYSNEIANNSLKEEIERHQKRLLRIFKKVLKKSSMTMEDLTR